MPIYRRRFLFAFAAELAMQAHNNQTGHITITIVHVRTSMINCPLVIFSGQHASSSSAGSVTFGLTGSCFGITGSSVITGAEILGDRFLVQIFFVWIVPFGVRVDLGPKLIFFMSIERYSSGLRI